MLQVIVIGVGLKPESVLQGIGKCNDEVECGELGKEVCFPLLRILIVPLICMNPNVAGQIARRLNQLSPVFATVDISLIRTRRAEGDAETHDKTQHGEQDIRNH